MLGASSQVQDVTGVFSRLLLLCAVLALVAATLSQHAYGGCCKIGEEYWPAQGGINMVPLSVPWVPFCSFTLIAYDECDITTITWVCRDSSVGCQQYVPQGGRIVLATTSGACDSNNLEVFGHPEVCIVTAHMFPILCSPDPEHPGDYICTLSAICGCP